MKNYKCLLIIFLFSIQHNYSQDKLFLGEDLKPSTKENAHYYRLVTKQSDSLFYIKDYYITGELKYDGYFSNLKYKTSHKTSNWYTRAGFKSKTIKYNKGKILVNSDYYKDGSLRFKMLYRDGKPYQGTIKETIYCNEYVKGKRTRGLRFYEDEQNVAEEKAYKMYSDPNIYNFQKDNEYAFKSTYFNRKGKVLGALFYANVKQNRKKEGDYIDFYQIGDAATVIKSKTAYLNGVKEGVSIQFNKKGEQWLIGNYKNGKRNEGEFFKNSIISTFSNGIKIGKQLSLNKNHKIIATVSIKEGNYFTGKTLNNNNSTLETYVNGKLTKEETFHTHNRQVLKVMTLYKEESIYSSELYTKKGVLIGKGMFKNGEPYNGVHGVYKEYTNFSNYKNGKKNGISTLYGKNHEFVFETMYKNDTILWRKSLDPFKNNKTLLLRYKNNRFYNGAIYTYLTKEIYKDGEQVERTSYNYNKVGKKIITKVEYYKDGDYNPIKCIVYRNNKTYTITFNDKKPIDGIDWEDENRFITYKNGKREGSYKFFENGKPTEEGTYVNDKKQGVVTFNREGEQQTQCVFKLGKPITGTVMGYRSTISYLDGKKHGLTIKEFYFAYGLGGRGVVSTTYKNGIKEGLCVTTSNEKPFSSGTYKNDKPYSGSFYNEKKRRKDIYSNGKLHGLINGNASISYGSGNAGQISTTYKNGIKEGLCIIINDDKPFTKGIYKNDKPFSGSFYNLKENRKENYVNGKKHGVYKDYVGNEVTFYTTYNLDMKRIEKAYTISSKAKDSLLGEGVYKNNNPFNGSFIKYNSYKEFTKTNYKKGKKNGAESELNFENFKVVEEKRTTYKNDIKEGYYFNKKKEDLPKNRKIVEGYYKNDKPLSGTFITKDGYTITIVSTYKNGIKDGKEYYTLVRGKQKSNVIYKKGKIIEGIVLETNDYPLSYENDVFEHIYKDGKLQMINSTYEGLKTTIINTKKGFNISYTKNNGVKINNQIIFDTKKRKSGKIEYYENKSYLGALFFNEGKLTRGKVFLGHILNKFDKYDSTYIQVLNNRVETVLKPREKVGFYIKTISSPYISKYYVTHKHLTPIIMGFTESIDSKIIFEYYLNNDEFLTKMSMTNILTGVSGIAINYNDDADGKIIYSYDYFPTEESSDKHISIDKLTFDEMVKQVTEFNKKL